jgi:hypothetical protein
MSPRLVWVARILVAACSLFAGIAAVEGMLRAIGEHQPLVWEPDPELGWWHIPGAVAHWTEEGDAWIRINRAGMRDLEREVRKGEGTFRIGIFGDSMTEAVQVDLDQTFARLVEKQLTGATRRVEVLNFGVNGYSPLQAYLLHQRVAPAYALDAVLFAVFLDNDIADLDPALASGQRGAPFATERNGELVIDYERARQSYADYHRQPIHTIRRYSAIYRMLYALRLRWSGGGGLAGATSPQRDVVPRRYGLYTDPPPPTWDEAWTTLERILEEFHRQATSAGSRFAVVSLPAGQIAHDTVWEGLTQRYPAMRERQWDRLGPEARLGRLTAKHDIPFVSLLDRFRTCGSTCQGPLFFGSMGHLTPQGHELVADVLAKWLEDRNWLPN